MSAVIAPRKAGRPEVSLLGRKYGFLLPITRERVNGITFWNCACTGCNGYAHVPELRCVALNPPGERLVRVQHSLLTSGNKRSCGCQRLARSGSKDSILPKKEKPYFVPATLADYNRAGADVSRFAQSRELAYLYQAQSTTPAPKGEVLSLGNYTIEDQHGVKWYVDIDDAMKREEYPDESPEFWAATEEAINKAGRLRVTK